MKEKNMRSHFVALVAAAALMTVSVDVYAADYELVGFTNATFQGDQTIRGFTEGCQAEFGPDTRMCNSVEVIQTVNWPTLPSDTYAWTYPVFVSNPGSNQLKDASGIAADPVAFPGTFSCGRQWQSTAGYGLSTYSIDATRAQLGLHECNELTPIACCGPAPQAGIASVPFIGLFGHGLVIALILSTAGAMLLRRGQRAAALIGPGNRCEP